jgi:hypothetical protein
MVTLVIFTHTVMIHTSSVNFFVMSPFLFIQYPEWWWSIESWPEHELPLTSNMVLRLRMRRHFLPDTCTFITHMV